MVSLLILVIVFALIFDYLNGMHDASNAIATTVSTGVLSLRNAVIVAAIFNFIGAMTSTAVAKTIATGFADPSVVTQYVVLSALIGASIWNLITWYFGLPSSSSHAIVGGLAGAVVSNAGLYAFKWGALTQKFIVPLVISPLVGFSLAFILMIVLSWCFKTFKPTTVTNLSKKMQLFSSCAMAVSHGSNDSQKSMGIITLALLAFGSSAPAYLLPQKTGQVPTWVIIACAFMMALGTLAGGKRIIKTMGCKIIKISPLQGFAAEVSGAFTILLASKFAVPISTTHAINSSIMGAGVSKRLSSVRWGVAGNILLAWLLTLPASAFIAYGTLQLIHLFIK